MAETIDRRISANINLKTIYPTVASYKAAAFFDSPLIPHDLRRLEVAFDSGDFTDIVGNSGDVYDALLRYFQTGSNAGPPDSIVLCRLIETAVAPMWVNASVSTDVSVYAPISDGSFSVTDGTNTDAVTGLDYSSCNTYADVLAVHNAGLAAVTAPTVGGLNTAVFSLDATGRTVLTMPGTGSTQPTVEVVSGGGGTDLTVAAYLNVSEGVSVEGLDVETLVESYTALEEVFEDYWAVLIGSRTPDNTAKRQLAQLIETENRYVHFLENSGNATSSAASTDLNSVLQTYGLTRCGSMFSYHGLYPEFAQIGASLGSDKPGDTDFGYEIISNELDSGQASNSYGLLSPQLTVLEEKRYNWISTIAGIKHAFPGRSVSNQEIRLLLGRDWLTNDIQTRFYIARIERRVLGYDERSLAVYGYELGQSLGEAKDRNIITGYTYNMPTAADFTRAQQASHNVPLTNVFTAYLVISGWTYTISGNLVIPGE